MPKFVGRTIAGSREIKLAPRDAQLVKLSYSQAVKLPATEVYYELDTSDRGSRGSLAKRWHRWYATVETIESCEASTTKMHAAARYRRHRGLLHLALNLGAVARARVRESEWIYHLVNHVAYAGCARIGHRKLVETGLVNEPSLATWTDAGCVAVDAVLDMISDRNLAIYVVSNYEHARAIGKLNNAINGGLNDT